LNRLFKNVFLGKKGFSLTELMIGGAILAGVGLTGAKLFTQQKANQKMIEHEQLITIFHQNFARTFLNSTACNTTFNQWYNLPIPATTLTNRLWKCKPGFVCTGTFDSSKVEEIFPLGADNKRWIDNQKIWQINSVDVGGITSTGELRMSVEYFTDRPITKKT
jgi:type II secretory pathway pseudopilin PulG